MEFLKSKRKQRKLMQVLFYRVARYFQASKSTISQCFPWNIRLKNVTRNNFVGLV